MIKSYSLMIFTVMQEHLPEDSQIRHPRKWFSDEYKGEVPSLGKLWKWKVGPR